MGGEFAQRSEWNFDASLEWYVLQYELHHGMQKLVADLNALYRDNPALHNHDFEPQGFEWIDCHDAPQSILSYLRRSDGQTLIMVINFTPVVRLDYRIGVPYAGGYQEVFDSDSAYYGGSNAGNSGYLEHARSHG